MNTLTSWSLEEDAAMVLGSARFNLPVRPMVVFQSPGEGLAPHVVAAVAGEGAVLLHLRRLQMQVLLSGNIFGGDWDEAQPLLPILHP